MTHSHRERTKQTTSSPVDDRVNHASIIAVMAPDVGRTYSSGLWPWGDLLLLAIPRRGGRVRSADRIGFLKHYNAVRPHRALGQLSPFQAETARPEPIDLAAYRLRRKPVLGGLTSEYQLAA